MPVFPFHELRRAAWNLASGNVRPGEDVPVVASSDQEAGLVDALLAAADAAGAGTATAAVIACPADMADYRHTAPVVAAVERAGLTIVATSIRFPRAYDDLSRALFAAGRRQVLIDNAPLEDFVRGARRSAVGLPYAHIFVLACIRRAGCPGNASLRAPFVTLAKAGVHLRLPMPPQPGERRANRRGCRERRGWTPDRGPGRRIADMQRTANTVTHVTGL